MGRQLQSFDHSAPGLGSYVSHLHSLYERLVSLCREPVPELGADHDDFGDSAWVMWWVSLAEHHPMRGIVPKDTGWMN